MKRMTRLMCLALSLLLLMGCAPQVQTEENTTAPETSGAAVDFQEAVLTEAALEKIHALGESPEDNYRTWYEIFVYSFCDSNGDGIGDLPGVVSKLDYLQELGINGIWLMPVHPSQSYHKYDVADYYAIDPAYGTLEDMDDLLAACEARGIKVIMDLVLNHTANNHQWFLTAVEYLKALPEGAQPKPEECPYVDYYFFSREGGAGFHAIADSGWYYEGQFSPDMPDLNLGNGLVRQEINAIMDFWMSRGVHGFRLDAAKEFYTGQVSMNQEVLAWIQEIARQINPDVYLVAEVWENQGQIAEYYLSGFDSIFNFPFGDSSGKIVKALRGAGEERYVSAYAADLQKADEAYLASNPDYIDAPFLSNHDVGRIAGFLSRDPYKTKLAGAMNLFMGGSAFIYYGEEIGMVGSGNDPSKRAPMYWNPERNDGTTDLPPECELPAEYPFSSLREQRTDDSSIYNYYRQAIAIRKALPVISHGRVTAEESLNVNCISAQRKIWGEEQCIILMNLNAETAQVDLSGYGQWILAATLSADGGAIGMNGDQLELAPWGIAVLIPQ